MQDQNFTIYSNTQAHSATLSIGVGNFWNEEYTDKAGNSVNGATVGLWLSVADNAEPPQMIRVYVGQVLQFAGHTITVLEIGENARGKYVALTVRLIEGQ